MKEIIELTQEEAQSLFGPLNNNISIINTIFPGLSITTRGSRIIVSGPSEEVHKFTKKIKVLTESLKGNGFLSESQLLMVMSEDLQNVSYQENITEKSDVIIWCYDGTPIRAKTPNQKKVVQLIEKKDILLAIGPAGTGKTYTAVALALKFYKEGKVKRIVLTRPAVEAGESIGYLPGTVKEKLDPYLRPLYDALQEMISFQKLQEMMNKEIIQIIPLAFMRGRTLNNSFVILDEAQNATLLQLKMFLTRMGNGSKFIITGDITQSDLPGGKPSGLLTLLSILKKIKGIGFVFMNEKDVIRHPIVVRILRAFEKYELKEKNKPQNNTNDRK